MSTLTVRKPNIDLSRGFGRYWLGGDAWRTAFMNALSMSFPLGEQMFIDSVRAVPPETIPDPALRADVKDFIGQEASHRFVHEHYNAELARQGYPYTLEGRLRRRAARAARLPVTDRLAITCALEHYTAMLADYVLRNPAWLRDAEPQMRVLWSWHAAEETEHKAVAFDVYRAAGGGWGKRVLWYVHVSVAFWIDTLQQTAHNLRRDGRLFAPRTWASAARSLFGRRGIAWALVVPGLHYLSPRFHPWQHDNRDLLRLWLERNDGAYRTISSTPSRPASAARPWPNPGVDVIMGALKENAVIRYMGTRKNAEGASVYVFIVNGLEKEVREHALKQHPGCYEALPASVKAKIAANRAWLSKM